MIGKTAKARPDPALLPFRRERILAAGTLLALGPIPLAFGDSLQPSVLLVYLVAQRYIVEGIALSGQGGR